MTSYLAIALGGACGALLRYKTSELNSITYLPIGTLLANLFGSLCLGFFYFYFQNSSLNESYKLAITTGFLGALTTYSTLNLELFQFMNNGEMKLFAIYFILNASVGILAIFLGKELAKIL